MNSTPERCLVALLALGALLVTLFFLWVVTHNAAGYWRARQARKKLPPARRMRGCTGYWCDPDFHAKYPGIRHRR